MAGSAAPAAAEGAAAVADGGTTTAVAVDGSTDAATEGFTSIALPVGIAVGAGNNGEVGAVIDSVAVNAVPTVAVVVGACSTTVKLPV
jgi:hypothetical protein